MELKKYPQHNLEPKRPLFFIIGLIVALMCVISAFEWKSEYHQIELHPQDIPEEMLFNAPITIQPTPPPPNLVKIEKQIKAKALEVIEIDNNDIPEMLKEEISIPEIDLSDIQVTAIPEEPIELNNGLVESPATYPGGWEAFNQYVAKSINYPKRAISMNTQGSVFVKFTINTDGTISEIEVLKGIGMQCDEEAIRVLSKLPLLFTPAKNRGQKVPVKMILPVKFRLN